MTISTQLTQEEYDNLPTDKKTYYRNKRPDLLENVKYSVKKERNRERQFTQEEFDSLSAHLKFYYRHKRPELLENINA
jgi:hypothetical protein